jgi:hypothetical protein
MANQKDTPNLPSSSRMQMPSTGGNGTSGLIRETGGMAKKSTGVTRKVTAAAAGKGMGKSSPYSKIC